MLIVEDGTGLANANSYASLVEANDYFASLGNDDWDATATDDNEKALKNATQALDLNYGGRYLGSQLTDTQALLFPRKEFTDNDGIKHNAGFIPVGLKKAVFEYAVQFNSGTALIPNANPENNVIERTVKLDVLSESVKYSGAVNTTSNTKVNKLLRPYISKNGLTVVRA